MSVFSEIICRQYGKGSRVGLKRKICGSSTFVEKFSLVQKLSGHTGCVNTIIFSEDGAKCITGSGENCYGSCTHCQHRSNTTYPSDDTYVNLFDVETGTLVDRIPTIHTNNIFYVSTQLFCRSILFETVVLLHFNRPKTYLVGIVKY